MRIIGGKFRGRRIMAPSGDATRPTTDRVRESLFNILAHQADFSWEGARGLDLFAGSGALGLEALSRGAAFCLFVDHNTAARGAIRDNIEELGLFGQTRLHRRSAEQLGRKPAGVGDPFDLVFMDPPYRQGLIVSVLQGLLAGDWLSAHALLVAEHEREWEADLPPGFTCEDRRRFGDTEMSFIRPKIS